MSRMTVKCPKCNYEEFVISTSLNAELPPCPRCTDFVRMADITPPPGQKTVISTAGAQATEPTPPVHQPRPTQPPPKRRDMRDFGPEPRV